MIELDWTLIASALIFLATLAAFNKLLLRPMLQLLEQRKAQTVGLIELASRESDRYHAMLAEYEARIKEQRQQGYRHAEAVRNEALKARQEIVSEARQKGQEMVGAAKEQIQEELDGARQKLEVEAKQIASVIAERVLKAS